jgi:hypothetical protein
MRYEFPDAEIHKLNQSNKAYYYSMDWSLGNIVDNYRNMNLSHINFLIFKEYGVV